MRIRIVMIMIRVVIIGKIEKGRFYLLGIRSFGEEKKDIGIENIVNI